MPDSRAVIVWSNIDKPNDYQQMSPKGKQKVHVVLRGFKVDLTNYSVQHPHYICTGNLSEFVSFNTDKSFDIQFDNPWQKVRIIQNGQHIIKPRWPKNVENFTSADNGRNIKMTRQEYVIEALPIDGLYF